MSNAGSDRSDPDAGLVAAIARGDAAAARSLVDRHLPRLVRLARRMLRDDAEAEDVAQEVFLKVWKNAAAWKPGAAKFETWMHRVALNLCYDRLRKKKPSALDAAPEPEDPAPNPAQSLEADERAAAVARAVDALPERQRAAILLCHYEGLSNIDAAATLEVSVEALESLLARGRRALREALKDYAGAGGK